MSLASESGLILAVRVGKHTDRFLEELIKTTEGKTDCLHWNTDDWGGYQRVLLEYFNHQTGKKKTQRWERTNGIIRQQTGKWHRRQKNKFGKVWEQTKVTARLVVSYFNWIWINSRLRTTATQRAELSNESWTWDNLATYPTVF